MNEMSTVLSTYPSGPGTDEMCERPDCVAQEAGCTYCVTVMAVTLLSEVLPGQLVAFLPMILLGLFSYPDIHQCYLSVCPQTGSLLDT